MAGLPQRPDDSETVPFRGQAVAVRVFLPPDCKAWAERLSARHGMTLSAYVRGLVMNQYDRASVDRSR